MYHKENCCANCGYAEDFYPDESKMICNFCCEVVNIDGICQMYDRNPYYEDNHREEIEDAHKERAVCD